MKQPFFLLLLFLSIAASAQPLHIYSIASVRQPVGDVGYTLDGGMMSNYIREHLLDPANFGPNGIYKRQIIIHDSFAESNSLTGISKIDKSAFLFIGTFDLNNPATVRFTEAELDSVFAWTMRGGRVINTSGLYWSVTGYDSRLLNARYGFEISNSQGQYLIGNPYEPKGSPFNGPFGPVNRVPQGGGAQGYYSKLPKSHVVMAKDGAGRPTMLMDCNTMDFLVADIDAFTFLNGQYLQGPSAGPGLPPLPPAALVDADKLFGNMLDFLSQLPLPPAIVNDGKKLSLSSDYTSYQWFRDDEELSGETGTEIQARNNGVYHVEVPVRGGCKVRSNSIEFRHGRVVDNSKWCDVFVPSAFSPDGNALNEQIHIYGAGCLSDLDFRIFDRWGELVFQTTNTHDGWDGIFNGQKAPSGVFAWSLSGKFPDGVKYEQKGHLTLVR